MKSHTVTPGDAAAPQAATNTFSNNGIALPAQSVAATRPNNTGMPTQLKTGIEQMSGISMDDVKVHYNSDKPAQLQALAYAQGSDIHIGAGQEKHLPHEAWHVVQQKQGRVQANLQMKSGIGINADRHLEHEADVMGNQAMQQSEVIQPAGLQTIPSASSNVLQPMMGFELELLVLVDTDGRPVPEKTFLGRYGAQNLELQVDHNGSVEADTPRHPKEANFQVATNLPPLVGPGAPTLVQLNAYDLRNTHERSVRPLVGGTPDPRAALNYDLLNPVTWANATADAEFARPPAVTSANLDNRALVRIDNAIAAYRSEVADWEAARARVQLMEIKMAAADWKGHNTQPSIFHPLDRGDYNDVKAVMDRIYNEAQQHYVFWINPAHQDPATSGFQPQFRRRATVLNPAGPWSANHPIAGQGTSKYASILEIVTRPYAVETPAGAADMVTAMTEAATLAQAIQNGTGNFANRIPLNTIPHTAVINPLTHVGNSGQPAQSIDASIQSTFAIDLAQIPSLMKSTVGFGAPQSQISLKHQGDVGASAQNPGGINRAEREMSAAVTSATSVINDMKGQIGGGAPSFVNLRGLITLVCQYLRLGKYWTDGVTQSLDKNLTDLLSRTNLAHIYRDLVPPAEKVWLNAAAVNMNYMLGRIMHHAGRTGATMLFNNAAENRLAGGGVFSVTCTAFVNNVFTTADDGITARLGGFQQRPHESVDPLGNRGGDSRPLGTATRQAPVFEMRNMIPKNDEERFPVASWVPMTQYMVELIQLLNARTEASATQDARVWEHAGNNPLNPPGLGVPEQAW